jgi:hypothetical protein
MIISHRSYYKRQAIGLPVIKSMYDVDAPVMHLAALLSARRVATTRILPNPGKLCYAQRSFVQYFLFMPLAFLPFPRIFMFTTSINPLM